MVLTDSSPFAQNMLHVLIRNKEGKAINLEVSPQWSVEQLKQTASEHLYLPTLDMTAASSQADSVRLQDLGDEFLRGSSPSLGVAGAQLMSLLSMGRPLGMPSVRMYHLLHVRTGKILPDEATIKLENILDGDEFLLYTRRNTMDSSGKQNPVHASGPSKSMILRATANVTPKNMDRQPEEYLSSSDFNSELRRLLVPLIEISQRLLAYSPHAEYILSEAAELLKPEGSSAKQLEADTTCVRQLQDMGFPEDKAKLALLHSSNNVGMAAEWILRHTEDDRVWEELSAAASNTNQSEVTHREVFLPKKVTDILECYRRLHTSAFTADLKAVFNLRHMGFAEADVHQALRLHGNDQDSACEWLLSERSSTNQAAAATHSLECGLDPGSALYKAITSSPTLQLGLAKPKTLIALLQILKRPTAVARWLGDPDLGPLLLHMSKLYQDEYRPPTET